MSKKWAASITADIASPEKPILIDEIVFDGHDHPFRNLAACKRNGHWFYRSADPARSNDPWNLWREIVDPRDDLKFNQIANERIDEIEIWGAFNRSPFRHLFNEGDKPMNPPKSINALEAKKALEEHGHQVHHVMPANSGADHDDLECWIVDGQPPISGAELMALAGQLNGREPVGAQTGALPQREKTVMCPKCDQVIVIEMDTRPDGKIVCDTCKGRFTNYEALMKAVEKKRPPAPLAPVVAQAIAVARIDPNPEQPRQDFDEAKLRELADSIVANGLIQPITVEPVGDRFILHDGERRWRAHLLAGLAEIPAYIVPPGTSPQQLLLRAIVANDQRADLSSIERAKGYQKLHEEHKLSDDQIAKQVGKSRSVVANTRRLLNLPEDQQKQVASGELNERQALALLPFYQLPEPAQEKILGTWQGKELTKPQKLTSDDIRQRYNDAITNAGRPIKIIDPASPYTGDGIYHPTCVGCDCCIKRVKEGVDDLRCINTPCLELKQIIVKRASLEQAKAAIGLDYLDPGVEYKWDQFSGFYGSDGKKPLN